MYIFYKCRNKIVHNFMTQTAVTVLWDYTEYNLGNLQAIVR
jgi:hypothetical protein